MGIPAELLGLGLLGSVVALIGGILFLTVQSWSRWLVRYSTPFAAGVLLSVSLLSLIPEAVHGAGESAYGITLLAFLGAFLFERLLFGLHHHEGRAHDELHPGSAPLVVIGDSIHNFVDGVAIAASYLANPGLGLITAVSTFLHEVPHEIGDFGILLKAGWKRRNIILVNIASALMTFVGIGLVVWFVRDDVVIGTLLAVAAGIFLYLGASDFLPHTEHTSRPVMLKSVIAVLIGVLLMAITLKAVPHSHGEGDSHHDEHHDESVMITPASSV